MVAPPSAPPLPFTRAAIPSPGSSPHLILIGDADDWTPARRCLTLEHMLAKNGHTLDVVVYPGAVHGFDGTAPRHIYLGHAVGGDPAAAADAFARTRRFFDERLRGSAAAGVPPQGRLAAASTAGVAAGTASVTQTASPWLRSTASSRSGIGSLAAAP